MLNQNYIKIFENVAGEVTIAYSASGENALEIGEVQHIAIKHEDLNLIASALLDIADSIELED